MTVLILLDCRKMYADSSSLNIIFIRAIGNPNLPGEGAIQLSIQLYIAKCSYIQSYIGPSLSIFEHPIDRMKMILGQGGSQCHVLQL